MKFLRHYYWFLPLSAFFGVFNYFLFVHFPTVGHDYMFIITRLVAGKWHFLHNGFLPFRYSAHFCAGFPQYGNPQDLFYSLPQLLTFVFAPWTAILLTYLLTMVAGYIGWQRFGRDVIRLSSAWSHVLALVISANGYYLVHMIAGHLMFHTVPLIGPLLWLLARPSRQSLYRDAATSAAGSALIIAAMLYSGGFQIVLLALMSWALVLCAGLILTDSSMRRVLLMRTLFAAILTLLICISKIVAVASLMRFFPREMSFARFPADVSILQYIFTAFWAFPVREELFTFLRPPWPLHEYTFFLSPFTLFGILVLPYILFCHRALFRRTRFRTLIGAIMMVLIVPFFLQLIRGYGVLVTPLESLPVFSSLRVVTRFLYVVSLGVIIVSLWSLSVFFLQIRRAAMSPFFMFLLSGTTVLVFFFAYDGAVHSNAFWMQVSYDSLQEALQSKNAYTQEIQEILPGQHTLTLVQDGVTSMECHESLFGYDSKQQISTVRPGPVTDVFDGAYNLHHPACFQYPEFYGCKPGDRIPVDDKENFERFRKGEKTSWGVPLYQSVSDVLSLTAFIGCIILLVWANMRRKK